LPGCSNVSCEVTVPSGQRTSAVRTLVLTKRRKLYDLLQEIPESMCKQHSKRNQHQPKDDQQYPQLRAHGALTWLRSASRALEGHVSFRSNMIACPSSSLLMPVI
jgi:hypothetical protein